MPPKVMWGSPMTKMWAKNGKNCQKKSNNKNDCSKYNNDQNLQNSGEKNQKNCFVPNAPKIYFAVSNEQHLHFICESKMPKN